MSLQLPVAISERSPWVTAWPSGSMRSRRLSTIETTSMRPSGSQPRPEMASSALNIVSRVPSGAIATTSWACMSENQSRPSRQRGPSGNASPSSNVFSVRAIDRRSSFPHHGHSPTRSASRRTPPLPLAGRGGGWGCKLPVADWRVEPLVTLDPARTPTPDPSPQGGGEPNAEAPAPRAALPRRHRA